MNRIFAENTALLPPPGRTRDSAVKDKQDVFQSYAPPNAQMRARVRRLEDTEEIMPVEDVSNQYLLKRQTEEVEETNNEQAVTMKFEAEVKFEGQLPAEGLRLETALVLKPEEGK